MHRIPGPLAMSFVLVVALLYSGVILGVRFLNGRPKGMLTPDMGLRLALGGWILVTGLLGLQGFFMDFSAMPPRIGIAMVFGLIFFAVFAFSLPMTKWLRRIPQVALIGLQTFRIVIEIQLHFLAQTDFFPEIMTWTGRNFDIVVGLSAPLIAYVVHRVGESRSTVLIVAWNIASMLILANTVVTGLLSAPTPIQAFDVVPANTAIGMFPFVWLPAFVVPFAFFLHLLSLRRALRKHHAGHVVA